MGGVVRGQPCGLNSFNPGNSGLPLAREDAGQGFDTAELPQRIVAVSGEGMGIGGGESQDYGGGVDDFLE